MDLATMPEEKLTLIGRRHEYGEVYTYFFKSENPIPYVPGQYAHVRLFGMNPEDKAVREFSFASAPHEAEIWFGVDARSGSPYQKRLLEMSIGDTAGIFKIKSHMTWPPVQPEVVMIAGGVGVTPFRSMLQDLRNKGEAHTTILIHASSEEYLYREELVELASEYIPTDRESNVAVVSGIAGALPFAHYYVAGSPDFVAMVQELLLTFGVTHIEMDAFKGLHEA